MTPNLPTRSLYARFARRKKAFQWKWKTFAQNLLLRCCRLSWQLPSGVVLPVESVADWSVFNEVFVDCAYDEALLNTIQSGNRSRIRILDLGANVGFFSLRALHLHRQQRMHDHCCIWQVEAQPSTYKILRRRLQQQQIDAATEELRPTLGAAGKREGEAFIEKNCFHSMAGLGTGTDVKGSRVEFVDLDELVGREGKIDLIKCDIEGSEEMLLESFSDLLSRADRLVIEIHRFRCDYGHCVALIEAAGLARCKIIMENEWISLEYFARDNAAS